MLRLNDLYYEDIIVNKKAIRWVLKNQKLLKEKFSKRFPKSPAEYTVQIKTKRGTILFDSVGLFVKKSGRSAFLTWALLKRLGCESDV